MKAFVPILIYIAVGTAFAVPISENVEIKEYQRFIDVTDSDGTVHTMDLEATPNMALVEEVMRNPTSNDYMLYTRQNPTTGQRLVMNVAVTIKESNFNPERPTVVIAHGWLINQMMTMSSSLRNVLLETGDVNVIVLDWRLIALQEFVTASAATPSVGRALGQFLAFLHEVTGASYDSMHLVGFNLGAHLVGNAGRALDGRVARVTGLDPSGPLWNFNDFRLNRNDGVYVECIHTDGGVSGLGIGTPLGDVDFFPNGGISQPGCLTSYCDHNRAWQFFDATVRFNHLLGNQCSNLLQVSINTCRGERLHMGNNILTKRGSGMFRVNTGMIYPF